MDTHTHKLTELSISFIQKRKKPTIIIANTIKGKGISFMENSPQWHSKVLEKKDYLLAKQELM